MTRETQRYYDGFSTRYSDERRHGYFGWVNELEVAVISAKVEGRKVLELGCGTGLILDRVRDLAPESLIGVDLSSGMLADARAGDHAVACGSALALPFKDGSFDLVYSFKVLPHVSDLRLALAEAMRVVDAKGELYAELYNPFSLKGVWDKLRGARSQVHLRHDTPAMVRAAAPAGCKVEFVAGIRIFGPVAASYEGRVGALMRSLDRWAMYGPLRYIAGYQIHRIRHVQPS